MSDLSPEVREAAKMAHAYATQFFEACEACTEAEAKLVGSATALCPKCDKKASRVIEFLRPLILASHPLVALWREWVEAYKAWKESDGGVGAQVARARLQQADDALLNYRSDT